MQSFPLYECGPGCKCNHYGKEKLRELISTSGTAEHMAENLHCKENLGKPLKKPVAKAPYFKPMDYYWQNKSIRNPKVTPNFPLQSYAGANTIRRCRP